MTHSGPYFGRNMVVFCFWDPERGGGAPHSGSATVNYGRFYLNAFS